MLTSVQKEILQTLINLYQSSNGKSVKGEDIAEVMGRNPGTIRNQMQSLRSLGLDSKVPIYKNGKRVEDVSVAKIEFTSVPQPSECEAAIKILGSIKDLNLGDTISIGPTPVNNLGVIGEIVGRDDMDNILLVDTTTIRSIPKQTVGDIASRDVKSFKIDCSVKEAAKKLVDNEIDGAPVIKDGKVVGVFTLTDLVQAIADDNENKTMLKKSISRLIIADNDNNLLGIVTRTDLINIITNLEQFPIVTN